MKMQMSPSERLNISTNSFFPLRKEPLHLTYRFNQLTQIHNNFVFSTFSGRTELESIEYKIDIDLATKGYTMSQIIYENGSKSS